MMFFFSFTCHFRNLTVLTPSCPTRRSSDLAGVRVDLPPRPGDGDPGATESAQPPAVTVGPDDAACIAFTSGSTGTPKGIVGLHRSLTRSEEHTSELQSLMRNSYAVFCFTKKRR